MDGISTVSSTRITATRDVEGWDLENVTEMTVEGPGTVVSEVYPRTSTRQDVSPDTGYPLSIHSLCISEETRVVLTVVRCM